MAFSGAGTGVLGDPYQITTWAQFKEIKNEKDKHYLLMNDIDANGDSIINDYLKFTGVLDGANYELRNYGAPNSTNYLLIPGIGSIIKKYQDSEL